MPPAIYLAKSGATNPPVIPADAVTRTFGIFGMKGSGKTTTGRVLAEGICKLGGNVAVLDQVGVWWGITRDGEGPGVPGVVLGGEHADIPLEETAGQLVAEFVVSRQHPVVVIDLKLMRKGAAKRFMADFLEGVYDLNRRPLHLIFEEADRALPQNPRGMDPTLGRVLGAAEDIVKLGRSRGLGSTFISQRMATVTKNVVEQVEALILHAQPGPRDRRAVKEWVEANGDPKATARVLDSMATLGQGEAWLYSPAWMRVLERIRVKRPKTLDSSSTPNDDERDREESAPRAPVDLEGLRVAMAESVRRAEENDPKKLHARIAALEKQLSESPAAEPAEPERVLVPDRDAIARLLQLPPAVQVLADELTELLSHEREEAQRREREFLERVEEKQAEFEGLLGALVAVADTAAALPPDGRPASTPTQGGHRGLDATARYADAAPRETTRDLRTPVGNGIAVKPLGHVPPEEPQEGLSRGALELVAGLDPFYPLWLDRGQLALLLGRGRNSSTLTQQLAEGVEKGGLEKRDGRYRSAIDAKGGDVPSVTQLRNNFRAALPPGPRAMFDVLLSAYEGNHGSQELERGELFAAAGFSATSSTPISHLKMLVDNGLAERSGVGRVTLGPVVR